MVWLRVQKTERMSTDNSGVSCLESRQLPALTGFPLISTNTTTFNNINIAGNQYQVLVGLELDICLTL